MAARSARCASCWRTPRTASASSPSSWTRRRWHRISHAPGRARRGSTPAATPRDPNRPGARPQADVDPTVGESERTASLNTGSRQHVDAFTGAVPRDDDREGGSGRVEHLQVLVPFTAARLKEADEQVVLETLREVDLARLPAFQPATA